MLSGRNVHVAPSATNSNTIYLSPRYVLIRLFDSLRRPLPAASYEVTAGARTVAGQADSQGYAQIEGVEALTQCEVCWTPACAAPSGEAESEDARAVPYRRVLFLATETEDSKTAAQHRLHNLGYDIEAPLEERVKAFQADYGLVVNGDWSDRATQEKLSAVHADLSPVPAAALVSRIPAGFDGGED